MKPQPRMPVRSSSADRLEDGSRADEEEQLLRKTSISNVSIVMMDSDSSAQRGRPNSFCVDLTPETLGPKNDVERAATIECDTRDCTAQPLLVKSGFAPAPGKGGFVERGELPSLPEVGSSSPGLAYHVAYGISVPYWVSQT